ncbi:asparaginase [Manganibacter manganicus]|uniref:Asparaginase n=1 Tax=Manganibacter manganicus TaxID=1873176 RepID=A0A1V8RPR6_9HYPH|nr:asparaginase [Pseudaminobacter manganicus]OQM75187.1 asparaginase [Pseudaminobacter manganicus]
MTNPVLIEVLRGSIVESAHRGAVCVADADGGIVWETGDTERPVFPRSAVKAIQALPLVESGAADAYGFGQRELALACASHSGEAAHAELARAMLAKAGLDESALECGTQWPTNRAAADMLTRGGAKPCALHNNCSGKHSGFLCTCVHAGFDHHGYVGADHPEQEMVRSAMETVTEASHGPENRGTDGCSIPTYAVPLRNLARGFARMVSGNGLGPQRAKAAERLLKACMAEPFLVSGTGRADIALMEAAPGRIFAKTGAEGVYCAALPELGYGIALKCDDGATRASEAMIAAVLARMLAGDEGVAATLNTLANPVFSNWNGIDVASLRPTTAMHSEG